jgi:hypothetical protein
MAKEIFIDERYISVTNMKLITAREEITLG